MKINRQYVISVYSLFALIAISLHIAMSDSALAHDELKSECSVLHEFEVLREQFLEKVEGVEDGPQKMLALLDVIAEAPVRILHDYRLDSGEESWVSEIDKIVVDSFYDNLSGESFRILKLKMHGPYDEDEIKRLIGRRAKSLCGAFPLSAMGDRFLVEEAIGFVVLISSYWVVCDASVLKAIEANMTRWTQEEAIPAVLFLASRGIPEYEKMAEGFDEDENGKRLRIICDTLHRDTESVGENGVEEDK